MTEDNGKQGFVVHPYNSEIERGIAARSESEGAFGIKIYRHQPTLQVTKQSAHKHREIHGQQKQPDLLTDLVDGEGDQTRPTKKEVKPGIGRIHRAAKWSLHSRERD